MYKTEREFQQGFGRWCKKNGRFYHKISDQSMGMKPYDCIVTNVSGTYHIELKIANTKKTSIGRLLRPQQIGNLELISKLGGNPYVLVYYKKDYDICMYHIDDLNTPVFKLNFKHKA